MKHCNLFVLSLLGVMLICPGLYSQVPQDRPPDSLFVYQQLGYIRLQQEQWQEAIQAARQGIVTYPDDAVLLNIKAYAAYQLNDLEALEASYSRLYDQNPDNVDIGLDYAQILLAAGKIHHSHEVYEELFETFPQERKVYQTLIDLYRTNYNYPFLLQIYYRKRQAFPDDQDILRELASTYEILSAWDEARAVYDTLLYETTDTLRIYQAMANTYLRQERHGEALVLYEVLLSRYPDKPGIMQMSGKLFELTGRWHEALDIYSRLADTSDDPDALWRMGRAYENLGHYAMASEAYQLSLEVGTTHPLPYYRLASLALTQQKEMAQTYDLAVKALHAGMRQIVSLQQARYGLLAGAPGEPTMAETPDRKELAKDLQETNEITEEVFYFIIDNFSFEQTKNVIEALPHNYPGSSHLHFMLGRYYERYGLRYKALEHYSTAIRLHPDNRSAHLASAELYESEGAVKEAIVAYERALTLAPEEAVAYKALIRLYRQQGTIDNLCDRWQAWHRGQPSNEVLREHLIEALHKAGRYDEAKSMIRNNE